jgi:hypothetical protein
MFFTLYFTGMTSGETSLSLRSRARLKIISASKGKFS